MSMIKQLMEVAIEWENRVEDIVDEVKEHPDFEVAITSLNLSKNDRPVRRIVKSITDDDNLAKAVIDWFRDDSSQNVTESFSAEISSEDLQVITSNVRSGKEIPDEVMDRIQMWLWDEHPDWMPYGIAKARTGDPYQWIDDHIDEIIIQLKRYFAKKP